MGEITRELRAIGKLIDSARLITIIRREVKAALKDKRALVIGGEHAERRVKGSSKYDVVVFHQHGKEETELLARRIRASMPDLEVDDKMIDNVIGIRTARRGKK